MKHVMDRLWEMPVLEISHVCLRFCHGMLEIHQRLDGCGVHAVTHRKIIRHVIAKEDHRPHVGEGSITARVDVIGVHAFEHERLTRQIRAQTVARMIGWRTQEKRHGVRR